MCTGAAALKDNDVFGVYILSVMPVVIRGFVLAAFSRPPWAHERRQQLMATSMTAVVHSYLARHRSDSHRIAARVFTARSRR
jgi:hypothetical protein